MADSGVHRSKHMPSGFLLFKTMNDRDASNPEGGVHGCTPFSDRARMASRKMLRRSAADALLTSQRQFLLVTFLCARKEKLPARRAEALFFEAKQSH